MDALANPPGAADQEVGAQTKRLNVILPQDTYNELVRLAASRNRTVSDVVRMALGIAQVAIEETSRGNILFIGKRDGKPLKQLVIW